MIVFVTGLLACARHPARRSACMRVLTIALAVTVIGNAALVSCEVVGETALARIVPREALGRVIGIFDAVSVAAMIAGAILAPVLVTLTSLRASLLILGAAAMLITLLCGLGLRGLDALNAQRADALASRVKVLEGLPVTAGVPRIVLEQLAAGAQFCPLPPGIDIVVQGAPAHAFYAVAEGRVVVHRDGEAVVHLGPGDSFGERGLLDRGPAQRHRHHGDGHDAAPGGGPRATRRARGGARPAAALDLSSTAPGVQVPPGETAVVDDPRWSEA